MASTSLNNAVIAPLYAKKLESIPDIPAGTASRVDVDVYLREVLGFPVISSSTDTGRTADMDAYFKKLKFLLVLPDGSKTLTNDEFLLWLETRPRICDAWRKCIKALHQEAVDQIQKKEDGARGVLEKFGGFSMQELDGRMREGYSEEDFTADFTKGLLKELEDMLDGFQKRKEELLNQNKGLFAGFPDKLSAATKTPGSDAERRSPSNAVDTTAGTAALVETATSSPALNDTELTSPVSALATDEDRSTAKASTLAETPDVVMEG